MSEPRALPATPAVRRPRYGAALKIVRRIHMYTGLLLFPWVLVFGISGFLFNHPTLGDAVRVETVDEARLTALTGFSPMSPDDLARDVVDALNHSEGGQGARYELDARFDSRFSGFTVLQGAGDGVRHLVIVDLKDGTAKVSTRAVGAAQDAAPFARTAVDVPGATMTALEGKLGELLPKLGMPTKGPLKANPKNAPELRFRMRDGEHRLWNVTYDFGSGRLDGRLADETPGLGFAELLSRLHKTHHYPVDMGASWLWALLADMTGLTMVSWALSGLVMWWQMKPTRTLGALAVAAAAVAAVAIIGGTLDEIRFGNVQRRTGPAEESPSPPKAPGTAERSAAAPDALGAPVAPRP